MNVPAIRTDTQTRLLDVDGQMIQTPILKRRDVDDMLTPRLHMLSEAVQHHVAFRAWLVATLTEVNRLGDDVTASSIATCVYNLAYLQLMPGAAVGHAYFVPFNMGQTGRKAAQLIVGYQGYLELAYRNDFLAGITVECVLRGEPYDRVNTSSGPQLKHTLPLERSPSWENLMAVYCQYQTRAGRTDIVTVSRDELAKLKKRFGSRGTSVWSSDPVAMSLKTAIRRASKSWRQSADLSWANHLSNQADDELPQPAPPIDAASVPVDEAGDASRDVAALVKAEQVAPDVAIDDEFANCVSEAQVNRIVAQRAMSCTSDAELDSIKKAADEYITMIRESEAADGD